MQAIRSDLEKLLWHGGRPHMDSGLATFVAPRNDNEFSAPAKKITLADFDAVMTQNAVGGGGVEVEVRK